MNSAKQQIGSNPSKSTEIARRIKGKLLDGSVLKALGAKVAPSNKRKFIQALGAYDSEPDGPAADLLRGRIQNIALQMDESNAHMLKSAIPALKQNLSSPESQKILDFLEKAYLFSQLGTGSNDDLIRDLYNGDKDVCNRAAIDLYVVLNKLSDHPKTRQVINLAVPKLIEMLSYEDEWTRKNSADLLNECAKISPGNRLLWEAVPVLIDNLDSDELKFSISYALTHIAGAHIHQEEISDIVSALVKMLFDGNENVRMAAASSIKSLSEKDPENKYLIEHAPSIMKAIHDEDSWVKYEVLEALRNISDPRSVPALLEVLKEKDVDCKGFAIEALNRIAKKTNDRELMEPCLDLLHASSQDYTLYSSDRDLASETVYYIAKLGPKKES